MAKMFSCRVSKGYCIALPKPRRKTTLAPYYENILNHDTNEYILKYLFHVQYIMPYIMVKVTEDIVKLVTLTVERTT
jgi:hypothetical protein